MQPPFGNVFGAEAVAISIHMGIVIPIEAPARAFRGRDVRREIEEMKIGCPG